MADLVSRLEIYRAEVEAAIWDPGQWDCLLALARWCALATGRDPGAPFRGRYAGDVGAARMLRRQGGIVRVIGAAFEPMGWARTPTATPGAVAAVRLNGLGLRLFGAVAYGERWLVACRDGALIENARPAAIWSLPEVTAHD